MNPVQAEEKLVLGLYASIPSQVSRIRTYHLVVSRIGEDCHFDLCLLLPFLCLHSFTWLLPLEHVRVGYHHKYWKGRSAGGMWPAKCAYIGSDNLTAMANLPRLADRALTDFWRSYYTWMCSGDLISWSSWEISSMSLKDSGPAIVLL